VLGEQYTPLTSAIHSESFESLGVAGKSSSLQVKETLHLLVESGASPDLCEPDHKQRVEQLLNISPQDCEMMVLLQRLVKQPRRGFTRDCAKQSFYDRQVALLALIQGGADPKISCERD